MIRRTPRTTLFPYTTLSRSRGAAAPTAVGLPRLRARLRPLVEASPGAPSRWLRAGLDDEHAQDRKSTRLNSGHANISYAVFCLKKKSSSITIILSITTAQNN